MSSLQYDNMSPVLQQHHQITPAKKQIASIDPLLLLFPASDAAGRKARRSPDAAAGLTQAAWAAPTTFTSGVKSELKPFKTKRYSRCG